MENATIVVDKRCTNDMAWWVFRHELAHAFLNYTETMFLLQVALPQLAKDEELREFVEETLVRGAMVPHAQSCVKAA